MERLDVLAVWLHVVDQTQQGIGRSLADELVKSGVDARLADAAGTQHGESGVLVFGAWTDTLTHLMATLCRHATVLAVCCRPHMAADDMWRALHAGAADVLLWPDGGPAAVAAQVAARLRRWQAVQRMMDSHAVQDSLVGTSAPWRALVRNVVEVAAFTDSPVLITGETGTGKEQIAQLIHRLSGARGEPVVVDCTTLSPELAGSEFFGHERGAFTGASTPREGAFALANGGLLFLDEVGELPLAMQAQLLRVIQEQHYKRVGSNTWQPTRFRLVCATNRDLEAGVQDGSFRADLFYRLASWRCRPPPLRERQDDILPLAAHFLRLLAPAGARCEFDPAVRDYLLTRDYPGNVRDLRQTVARIWHRHCGPGPLTIGDVPPDERPRAAPVWPDAGFAGAIRHAVDLGMGLARITQTAADLAIQQVLELEDDNNQRAAARLGVTDRALQLRRKAWAALDGAAVSAAENSRRG